jgi:hypothetical protein
VIFTCSIPASTGDAAADAAADAAHVGEPEDSNDGNDDDELAVAPGKPKKILLYFTRSNPETPEQKLARYMSMATKNAKRNYTKEIDDYNKLIQEVVSDIEAEIDVVFDTVITEIGTAKSITKAIMTGTKQLLQLNWKLTALDYKELVLPVKPADINKATIEILSEYISQCSSIDLVKNSIKEKGDIVFNSKAYEINEEYLKLIDPFFDVSRSASRGAESAEIRCAKSCSYLKFRLPDVYIRKLVEKLEGIRDLITGKWPKIVMKNFALVKIIALLKLENMDNISDLIVGYLKEKNTVEQIKAVQTEPLTYDVAFSKPVDEDNISTDADENQEIEGTKKIIDDSYTALVAEVSEEGYYKEAKKDEFIEVVVRTLRSRIITKKVLVEKAPAEKVAPVKAKIKRAITSQDFDVIEYAQILLTLLGPQQGGGSASKDKPVYAHALFLIYLNSLITSLNGYEMMNGSDYVYFDAVARIVISAIQVTKTDHLSLLDTVYIEMLDTEWVDDFTSIENKDFKECVQIAAHNLGLQSLNLRRGPMPYDTYKGSKKIFEDVGFDSEFKKITSIVKNKSFYDRKLYLISRIESYIKSSSPQTPTPITPTAVPIILRQASHIPSSIEPSKEPLAGLAYGGSKTRGIKRKKRKNGSPRRKTLRKTRKHR